MTSFAQFVFEEALKIFLGDALLMGLAILIVFAVLFFISRFSLQVSALLFVVLLDGMVGFNYGQGAIAGFNGAFNDLLFIAILMFAYLFLLVVIGLGVIKAINK